MRLYFIPWYDLFAVLVWVWLMRRYLGRMDNPVAAYQLGVLFTLVLVAAWFTDAVFSVGQAIGDVFRNG